MLVDMAVDEIGGLPPVQQGEEGLKAPMGDVVFVSVSGDRGVGQNNVDSARPHDLQLEPEDTPTHLSLGVLIRSVVVSETAAETQDPQSVDDCKFVVDAVTALRRLPVVGGVVIAVDVQHGAVGHGDKKGQILSFQIAR